MNSSWALLVKSPGATSASTRRRTGTTFPALPTTRENTLPLERLRLELVGLVLAAQEEVQQGEIDLARRIIRPFAEFVLVERADFVQVTAVDAKLEERAVAQDGGHIELRINWRDGLGVYGGRLRTDGLDISKIRGAGTGRL